MSPWTQLFFLLAFSFTGLILGSLISMIVGMPLGIDILESPLNQPIYFIQISQIISSSFWLLIPAIVFIKLFYGNLCPYLNVEKKSPLIFFLMALFLVFAVQPLIGIFAYLNYNIPFPDSLVSIEKAFKNLTETNTAVMNYLFSDKTILGFIINVIVIAISAAIFEEIFFRGCLQKLIHKISKNYHIAVWITAIIFSAVHMDFYGFLPRIILGAMLGYLYVWSGNIWVPIFAHFTNNLTAIILKYCDINSLDDMDKYVPSENIVYIILSIIFIFLIVYYFCKKKINTQRY